MNKESFALPIERDKLSEHYKDVESFQRQRVKGARRLSKFFAAGFAISLLANAGQAFTIASILPLVKLVPVLLTVRPDGTVDSSVAMSQLPVSLNEAVKRAALWQYVRLREGYSYDAARYAYDVVSGMSSDVVRSQYQGWFNYPNPVSPQVTVARKGTIVIEHISSADIAPTVQQIRFKKTLAIVGTQPIVTTWTATVQYQLIENMPAEARLTNPGGVVVVAYQSAQDTVQ